MLQSDFSEVPETDNFTISVVFATKERLPLLQTTIKNIKRELDGKWAYEVVVVDGQSRDGTVDYLYTLPHVRVIVEEELRGCCFAYDTALRAARGTWVCWLNDDIEIVPGAFEKMMAFMNAPDNQRVGMGVFTASASAQEPYHFVLETCMPLPIPYACFGFLRRKLLEQVGYLDLSYRKYGWDPDLSMKIWDAGYTVEPCPGAHIIHHFADDELRRKDEDARIPDCQRLTDKWRQKAEAIALSIDLTNPIYDLVWDELDPRFQMQILVEQGRLDEAEQILNEHVSARPKIFTEFYLLGVTMEKRERFAKAADIYQRVMAYESYDPKIAAWAHFKYGELLSDQGQDEAAIDHWQQALQLNPDHAKANIYLTPSDRALQIICADRPHRRPEHVWVDMAPFDPELWEYHFGQRKLGLFELHGGVPKDALEPFTSLLLQYLETGGKFFLVDDGKIRKPNQMNHSVMAAYLSGRGFRLVENNGFPEGQVGKRSATSWVKEGHS